MAKGDVVLIPVFDDWASLALLLPSIDETLAAESRTASIILVDDCSAQPPRALVGPRPLATIESVDVLSLTRNIGHQRALAIGLSYIAVQRPCRAVILMDADGEDLPSDIPRLLAAFETNGDGRIVFAQRTRRFEGVVFTVFYKLYRFAHRLMTGIRVGVGNFSVVPYASLRKLAVVSEMWNHYAAAVVHAKLPSVLVPTAGGGDLPVAAGWISCLSDVDLPGWTVIALGFVVLLLAQAGFLAVVSAFMTQGGRARSSFIPVREYEPFVESFYRIWPAPTSASG